jgi:membrane-bound inhibitor of C-type lysozyme
MRFALAIIVAATLAGCAEQQRKEELEASKNTYVCLLEGDRLVVKFEFGMARMLMPGGERIDLYQIPAPSGVRYSNGNLELRGKATDLVLSDAASGNEFTLTQCSPYTVPKP